MPHKDTSVFMPEVPEDFDVSGLGLRVNGGTACVLMAHPREQTKGGVFLSDGAAKKLRPDSGKIAACADADYLGRHCLVRPYDGVRLPSYKDGRELRIYGTAWIGGKTKVVGWQENIVATHDGEGWIPTPLVAFVRRETVARSIATATPVYTNVCAVLAAGSDFEEKTGRIVVAAKEYDWLRVEFTDDDNLWIIPWDCVIGRIVE